MSLSVDGPAGKQDAKPQLAAAELTLPAFWINATTKEMSHITTNSES